MAKKVAFVVFEGRVPGVYSTWDETKLQTHEYNRSSQRGFTIEQGGREAAEKAYEAYVRSKQTNGGTAQDEGNTNEEQDVMAV